MNKQKSTKGVMCNLMQCGIQHSIITQIDGCMHSAYRGWADFLYIFFNNFCWCTTYPHVLKAMSSASLHSINSFLTAIASHLSTSPSEARGMSQPGAEHLLQWVLYWQVIECSCNLTLFRHRSGGPVGIIPLYLVSYGIVDTKGN